MNTLDEQQRYLASRRRFLRDGAIGAGALAGLASLDVNALAAGEAGESIDFWQYKYSSGQPGDKALADAAKRFKAQTGITVNITFKSAEGIQQAVTAAAQAHSGFDAMLWWSGPTARDQGRLGNVISLDGKIPQSTFAHKANRLAQSYGGKTYGLTFTGGTYFLVYNATLLKKAGISDDAIPPADEDPLLWDAFLEICEKVKKNTSVKAPLMFANKEGYFNEWWFYTLQAQAFDTAKQVEDINLGTKSWVNPQIVRAMKAWKTLYDRKLFYPGGEVIAYEQHVRQLASGQVALSAYFDVQGATAEARKVFGASNIRFSKIPAHRTDTKQWNALCNDVNSLYVSSWTKKQKAALAWLTFLTTPKQMTAWANATQEVPGDDRWTSSVISDPQTRLLYKGLSEKSTVYPYDFVTQNQYASLLKNGILYLNGKWSAEKLLQDFDKADKQFAKKPGG
jgi:ABC-type glycerol-3-phosphate transport system substrate-binding protein